MNMHILVTFSITLSLFLIGSFGLVYYLFWALSPQSKELSFLHVLSGVMISLLLILIAIIDTTKYTFGWFLTNYLDDVLYAALGLICIYAIGVIWAWPSSKR